MNESESIDQALRPVREATESLVSTVGPPPGQVHTAAIPAALRTLTLVRERVSELAARIEDASAQLCELEKTLYDPRHFDPAGWPERQEAIARELQRSPLDGAASWLTAWARAFLTGCPDEAERLVVEPFALPPEAAWCPDRFCTAQDALQARSAERLAPLLAYLADGAPLADRESAPADVRVRAAVLHARLTLDRGGTPRSRTAACGPRRCGGARGAGGAGPDARRRSRPSSGARR